MKPFFKNVISCIFDNDIMYFKCLKVGSINNQTIDFTESMQKTSLTLKLFAK